jgi:hypothetical protein
MQKDFAELRQAVDALKATVLAEAWRCRHGLAHGYGALLLVVLIGYALTAQ